MKLNTFVKSFVLPGTLAVLFSLPLLAFAQDNVQSGLSGIRSTFGFSGGITSATTLKDLIISIIRIMLLFAGIIAVVFVIIGGYMYITSGGNAEQAEKGKSTVVNAIIGIVMIILSYVIINVIVNLVSRPTY